MASISYIRNSTATQQKRRKPRPASAKTGVGYIRDVTNRTYEPPKPPAAVVGIDYIRNNTRKEQAARQAAANAAARKAAPAATPAPVAGNGTAAPAGYEDTVALTNPQENAAMKKDPALAGDKKKPAAAPATAAATPENPIDSIYNAAGRQLDKQERAAQAQLEARLADQRAFDEYVARVRQQANTTLGDQFAASAANAAKARDASLNTVRSYTDQAIASAGGNQDVLAASGAAANMTSNAFNTAATAQDSAAAQQLQGVLTEYQAGQSNMDLARSANMRSESEADRRATMSDIAQKRFDLSQEQAKARIEQANTDRQSALDQRMADIAEAQAVQKYGLDVYNAETQRIGTKTPEERAAERAMEENLNASTIAKNNADAKKALSSSMGSNAANKVMQDLNGWYGDEMKRLGVASVDDVGDAQSRIEIGRTAVQQLASMHDGLSVEQAYRALRAILPPHVINDNRIKQEIAAAFV